MDKKKTPGNKFRRNILLGIIMLFFIISLGVLFSPSEEDKAPDPEKMPQTDAVKYLASNEFASLPEKEQEIYMEKLREKSPESPPHKLFVALNKEERAAVRKNTRKLMHKKMRERIKKFFGMTPEEQDAFLDQEIEKMRERREQARAAGNNGRPGGPPPPGDGNHAARMQGMLENTDSTSRAQMHEFHRRMHERMQQQQ